MNSCMVSSLIIFTVWPLIQKIYTCIKATTNIHNRLTCDFSIVFSKDLDNDLSKGVRGIKRKSHSTSFLDNIHYCSHFPAEADRTFEVKCQYLIIFIWKFPITKNVTHLNHYLWSLLVTNLSFHFMFIIYTWWRWGQLQWTEGTGKRHKELYRFANWWSQAIRITKDARHYSNVATADIFCIIFS